MHKLGGNSRKYRPNVNRSFVQDTLKCVHYSVSDGGNSKPINKTSHIQLAIEHFSLLRIDAHETSREGRDGRKGKGGVNFHIQSSAWIGWIKPAHLCVRGELRVRPLIWPGMMLVKA
jgi:hypothetical protein